MTPKASSVEFFSFSRCVLFLFVLCFEKIETEKRLTHMMPAKETKKKKGNNL
jgi:hypothetical protein